MRNGKTGGSGSSSRLHQRINDDRPNAGVESTSRVALIVHVELSFRSRIHAYYDRWPAPATRSSLQSSASYDYYYSVKQADDCRSLFVRRSAPAFTDSGSCTG